MFVDAIERVSAGAGDLAPDSAERLSKLDQVVQIMVFVNPTCPYCPGAASMANRMAPTSPKMRSVVVEANEFAGLSQRFQVQGVPRTVVNRAGVASKSKRPSFQRSSAIKYINGPMSVPKRQDMFFVRSPDFD